ncbi:hypothetical protein CLU79DRAFT_887070 [Phycomyces nitens]|nr:hypothetical protein CLU79DRAFT_887070 [Phycomyces nitens]
MGNLYTWNKMCALSMNAIYLLSIFQDFYDSGNHIIEANYSSGDYRSIPAGAVVIIITSSIMMFCLLFDMVVMSTTKLSLAYHYWRPGLFFFAINCSCKGINMMRMLMSASDSIHDCEQKIMSADHSSHSLVSSICQVDIKLTHLTAAMALVRDVSICALYVVLSHIHLTKLVAQLKTQQSNILDTPLTIIGYQTPRMNNTSSPTFSEAPTLIDHRRQ